MFENKKNTLEDNSPFNIVFNYRSVSTKSSKVSKKHRIRKLSDAPMDLVLKKQRKMTEHIEVQGILEEEDLRAEARCALSEAKMERQQQFNMQQDLENCQLWYQPDLQKVIPVQLRQDELDEESPLELSPFRNICTFEQELLNKTE